MRGSILTVTDLTERSDAAVVWADTIARARGWDLHVGHAIALADRERGAQAGQLLHLERAILMADAASRAQIARTISSGPRPPTRVIDLDGLVPAMLRRAAHLRPDIVIVAAGWPWSTRDHPDALSRAAIDQLDAHLLVVRDALPPTTRRIVVALDAEYLDGAIIEAAARWSYWLREAVGLPGAQGIPELDVVLLADGDHAARDVARAILREPADLIVVPAAMITRVSPHPQTDLLMRHLLEDASGPVLLLKDVRPPWTVDVHADRVPAQRAVSLIA